mmetsp:Transcript_126907/g.320579  ORF Transcript_126907/g.320579 Transcript_126907/m.320579 type:complete len:342 (+) Transcript_126907:3321-4346(+)
MLRMDGHRGASSHEGLRYRAPAVVGVRRSGRQLHDGGPLLGLFCDAECGADDPSHRRRVRVRWRKEDLVCLPSTCHGRLPDDAHRLDVVRIAPGVEGLTCRQQDLGAPVEGPLKLDDGLRKAHAALHGDPVRGGEPRCGTELHPEGLELLADGGELVRAGGWNDEHHTILRRLRAVELEDDALDELLGAGDDRGGACDQDLRLLRQSGVQNQDVGATLVLELLQLHAVLANQVHGVVRVYLHALHFAARDLAVPLHKGRRAWVALHAEVGARRLHDQRGVVLRPLLRVAQDLVGLRDALEAHGRQRVVVVFVWVQDPALRVVRLLDLRWCRAPLQAQGLVV